MSYMDQEDFVEGRRQAALRETRDAFRDAVDDDLDDDFDEEDGSWLWDEY